MVETFLYLVWSERETDFSGGLDKWVETMKNKNKNKNKSQGETMKNNPSVYSQLSLT